MYLLYAMSPFDISGISHQDHIPSWKLHHHYCLRKRSQMEQWGPGTHPGFPCRQYKASLCKQFQLYLVQKNHNFFCIYKHVKKEGLGILPQNSSGGVVHSSWFVNVVSMMILIWRKKEPSNSVKTDSRHKPWKRRALKGNIAWLLF